MSRLAGELAAANVQFTVFCEDDFTAGRLKAAPALVVESRDVLNDTERALTEQYAAGGGKVIEGKSEEWLSQVKSAIDPGSVRIDGPATVRAYLSDTANETVVHLLNLNVRRKTSYEDVVIPATDVQIHVRVPFHAIGRVRTYSSDSATHVDEEKATANPVSSGSIVDLRVPRLDVAAMIVIFRSG